MLVTMYIDMIVYGIEPVGGGTRAHQPRMAKSPGIVGRAATCHDRVV